MNTENNPIKIHPNTHMSYPYRDELNMIEILDIILRNKLLIILTTSFISIVSIVYAYSINPTYQVNAYLSPPQVISINEMNKANIVENNQYSQKSLFEIYISNFKSKKLRENFLREKNIISQYCDKTNTQCIQDTIQDFNSNLEIKYLDKKEKTSVAMLTSSSMSGKITAETLNNYISYANLHTVNNIANNIKSSLSSELSLIKSQIDLHYKNQVESEINKLDEAIQIAKKLGYKKPYKNFSSENSISSSSLHLLGYEYLINKKAALLSRKYHHISTKTNPEVKNLLLKEYELKSIIYNPLLFSSVTIDQEARTPKYPIKPSKRKIAILGFTLGLVLSLFIVMVIQVRKNLIIYRQSLNND